MPKINEFSASTAGTDVEFIEVYGAANIDFSNYTLLELEGDSNSNMGVVDEVLAVGSTDNSGFWLANLPANALENGTITLLLVEGFSGALNDDLDTNDDGVFDVTPWVAIADSVAVNDGGAGDMTYGAPVLGPNYDGISSFAPGGASRIPDGFDTDSASDWVRNDFDLAGIPGFDGTAMARRSIQHPGATNTVFVAPPEACGDSVTPIFDVQGNGMSSPLSGNEVAIEGVVVADFQPDSQLKGFNLQDASGDGDMATSDGVFVYAPGSVDVSVGDLVRVRGTVSEYNGLTEIGAVSLVLQCATGMPLTPTEISLPVASVDDLEIYEGMLVTFPQPLFISEYFNFDRYNEIVLTTDRFLTPTAEFEPGSPEALDAMQQFLLNSITLDDARTSQNSDPALHPNGMSSTLLIASAVVMYSIM